MLMEVENLNNEDLFSDLDIEYAEEAIQRELDINQEKGE